MTQQPMIKLARVFAAYLVLALVAHALEDILKATGVTPADMQDESALAGFVITALILSSYELLSTAVRFSFLATNLDLAETEISQGRMIELQVIEAIRGLAAVLFRAPLLLIPAAIEVVRLLPIPFVVLFDRDYQKGRIDALYAARQIFIKHPIFVQVIFIPSSIVWLIELALSTSATNTPPIWSAGTIQLFSLIAFATAHLAVDILLISQFRKRIVTV